MAAIPPSTVRKLRRLSQNEWKHSAMKGSLKVKERFEVKKYDFGQEMGDPGLKEHKGKKIRVST